jgi:TonB-linked SusC/RagA family outer membrane protein
MEKMFRLMRGCKKKTHLQKMWMTMKLTIFFVFIAISQIMAIETYSQSTLLSLNLKSVAVKDVLDQIEQKSEFVFLYNSKLIDVDRMITVNIKDQKISDVLDRLFQDADVAYTVVDRQIVLTNKADQASFQGISNQQQKSVSGKVTDNAGISMPGVSVVIKGTTTGVITDLDGKFTLPKISENSILQFSFVGMKTEEIAIGNKTNVNVVMVEEAIGIEEVVAVGYGTQKKVNLTGSVESVKGEAILRQPVSQVSQALVGLVPGLTAIQSSGQPGKDNSDLRIRGIGSIGASNDPLILIDGVAGDINNLNSDDIEDMSVLKDAAAAAIYGSRASNGVILVTTKRAKSGKMSVKYSNYFGWEHINNQPEYLGALDFMKYSKMYTQEVIDNYAANMASNPDEYPDTDWIKELYTESGFRTQHNLGFSGGNESIRTLASISYTDESANIVNFNYKRVNARVNTDMKISAKFNINFDVNFVRSITKEPSAGLGPIVREVYRDYPNAVARHSDGSWGAGWYGDNGVAFAHDGGNSIAPSNNFTGTLRAIFSPIKDLKFSVMYAPNYRDVFIGTMRKRVPTISDWKTKTYVYSPSRNTYSQSFAQNFTHNFNALASYNRTFKNQSISALAGYEFIINDNSTFGASRQDYPLEKYEVLNAGSAATALNYGYASHWGLVSYFGRLNYSIFDRYLFEANLRRDASSRFGTGNKVSYFPSFSAGWRLSQEPFIKRLNLFSNLKLRASYGSSGNQQIGSDFPYASTIVLGGATTAAPAGNNFLFNNAIVLGATQGVLANKDIKWETTLTTNFGLDAGFLNEKLTLSAEYYIRETKDILLNLPIPGVLGLTPSVQNAGNVKNSGIDFSIGWQDSKGDFSYNARLNFSTVKNEVTNLGGLANIISGNSITKVGSPIGSIYGLESIGIFQTAEEITSAPTQFGTYIPGNVRYKDQLTIDTDGDKIFDKADGKINGDDRVIIGNPFPTISYGLTLGAEYKGFDLSASLIGVGKRDLLLSGYMIFPLQGKIQTWALTETWTPTNTGAKYPLIENTRANDSQVSSTWVCDAAYLRVRNVSFGYSLPKTWLKDFASSTRLYFSGQNLFTFDKLHKGIDPLTPNGSGGDLFPIPSTYIFGVEIQF